MCTYNTIQDFNCYTSLKSCMKISILKTAFHLHTDFRFTPSNSLVFEMEFKRITNFKDEPKFYLRTHAKALCESLS